MLRARCGNRRRTGLAPQPRHHRHKPRFIGGETAAFVIVDPHRARHPRQMPVQATGDVVWPTCRVSAPSDQARGCPASAHAPEPDDRAGPQSATAPGVPLAYRRRKDNATFTAAPGRGWCPQDLHPDRRCRWPMTEPVGCTSGSPCGRARRSRPIRLGLVATWIEHLRRIAAGRGTIRHGQRGTAACPVSGLTCAAMSGSTACANFGRPASAALPPGYHHRPPITP